MKHFVVIKKCLSDYDCKIYEALLIKKHQAKLKMMMMMMIFYSYLVTLLSICNVQYYEA